jgi:trans-AT polyketide synthase/acyltransferase/oxidoreductase domain-containing protein
MAMIFRWYFIHTMRIALEGIANDRANFQIQCGPALGSMNQWVEGTSLENWRNRHVDDMADRLMSEAAAVFNHRFRKLFVVDSAAPERDNSAG